MVGRWFFMIIGTIFSITPAFVYWLAGYLTIQGDPNAPTIGDIVAFTTLQSRLFFPMGQLLNVQVEIQGALALFDRIFEYLEMDPEIVDAPDAVDPRPRDGPRPGPPPGRLVPLPDRGRALMAGDRCRWPPSPMSRSTAGPETDAMVAAAPVDPAAVEAMVDSVTAVPRAPDDRDAPGLRARAHRLRRRAGPARGPRRAVGEWQDDDDLPDPTAVRRRLGRRRDRRPRRPAHHARLARAAGRAS